MKVIIQPLLIPDKWLKRENIAWGRNFHSRTIWANSTPFNIHLKISRKDKKFWRIKLGRVEESGSTWTQQQPSLGVVIGQGPAGSSWVEEGARQVTLSVWESWSVCGGMWHRASWGQRAQRPRNGSPTHLRGASQTLMCLNTPEDLLKMQSRFGPWILHFS